MSHFAKIEAGIITAVIVAEQDFIDIIDGKWVQTSYNTIAGVHYGSDNKPDNGIALRKNYARIGGVYDDVLDAFYTSQPYPSWTLDKETCTWIPPLPMPVVSQPIDLLAPRIHYGWNEPKQQWIELQPNGKFIVTLTIPATILKSTTPP